MKHFTIRLYINLFILLFPFVSFSQISDDLFSLEDGRNPEHLELALEHQAKNTSAVIRDEDDLLLATKKERFQAGVWVGADSSEYIYDSENLLIEIMYLSYFDATWKVTGRVVYEYDANNNAISVLSQGWINGNWVNSFRSTYEYDSNNNQISYISQEWFGTSWENRSKAIYEYDSSNNRTVSLFQNWNGISWYNNSRIFYYYQVVADVLDFETSSFSFDVFPNPGNGRFYIEFKKDGIEEGFFNVYNTNGQLLFNQRVSNQADTKTINISHLPQGTYFLQIKNIDQQAIKAIQIVH